MLEIYPPALFTVKSAVGCRVTDSQEKSYLDMTSGIGVTSMGHCHARIVSAIAEQAAQYAHVSNLIAQGPQKKLAERLCDITGMEKVLFTNSGTESTEGAIKLARKFGKTRGKEKLVAFSGAFHGRSSGAIALIDKPQYRQAFEPLLPETLTLPYNDCDALNALDERTAAVFVEYIQGEGGLIAATIAFARKLEEKQNQLGFLLIADEIQSGMGRTGRFFAYEHLDTKPDIVLMAKAIGGGLPLGALLARGEAATTFGPGDHGTTFGGNPISCAAGNAALDVLSDEGLVQKAAETGRYLKDCLIQLQAEFPAHILEVRGKGLMQGLVLRGPAKSLADKLLSRGIIVNVTAGNILRLLPPLIIERADIDECISAIQAEIFSS